MCQSKQIHELKQKATEKLSLARKNFHSNKVGKRNYKNKVELTSLIYHQKEMEECV